MARLTRKNIKVFAENATNNGVFGSLQANDPTTTNDVEQIQSLPAWSNGWDDATMTSEELPPLEEFQGVQYVVSYEQAYLMQEGLPEWSTSVTYFKGSLVKNITPTGFQIYNSLTDNNTGNMLSDTNNWKLVMDSDNLYAFDSAVVHKAGAETITGTKTFQGTGWITYIKNTSVTYNTAPSSATTTTIAFVDKNSQNMGAVECMREPDNATLMRLNAYGANGSWASQPLQLRVDANGNSYAYAPTPASNSNDSNIATTAWVNTVGNNVVHRSGNENISGSKTFTGNVHLPYGTLLTKSGVAIIGGTLHFEQPTGTSLTGNAFIDIYGNLMRFVGKNSSNNYTTPLYLDLETNVAMAPASDVTNSVVTTTGISKSGNGFVKLGNGIIIQWGFSTIDGSQVTLPTPFTTTNYRICATYMKASGSHGSGIGHVVTYPTTTTSFYANTEGGEYQWIAIGY